MREQQQQGEDGQDMFSPSFLKGFHCKRRQYNSVRVISVFLYPMVMQHLSTVTSDLVSGTEQQQEMNRFATYCEGTVSSLSHEGPISAAQVHSLQCLSGSTIQSIFTAFVRRQQPCSSVGNGSNSNSSTTAPASTLYPPPSALMSELWPPATIRRFEAARAVARSEKVKCSDDLSRDGYLRESGLHSMHVLGCSEREDSCDSSCCQDGEGSVLSRELRWRQLIDDYSLSLPDRSSVHELENLPQEIAIGELLCDAVRAGSHGLNCYREVEDHKPYPVDAVIDVGGGNGFLAAALSERLGCDAVVVDPYFPSHAIDCCPRRWADATNEERKRPRRERRFQMIRHMAFFKDITSSTVLGSDLEVSALPADFRCALVAKHLCGTAVDECLRHLIDNQSSFPWPVALVLAPCCYHKAVYEHYTNLDYLSRALSIHDANAFNQLVRLTSWISGAQEVEVKCEAGSEEVKANLTKKRQKSIYFLIPRADDITAGIEHLLNFGRQLWLQQHGYQTAYVQYVPPMVTPKNKCIVAVR